MRDEENLQALLEPKSFLASVLDSTTTRTTYQKLTPDRKLPTTTKTAAAMRLDGMNSHSYFILLEVPNSLYNS